jgi:hypothetical protein
VPDLFLAEKLVEMETKFKMFEENLSLLMAKQLTLEEQQGRPLMSQVVTGASIPPPPLAPTAVPHNVRPTPTSQQGQRGVQSATGGQGTPSSPVSRIGGNLDHRNNRDVSAKLSRTKSQSDTSGFSVPRDHRRRQERKDRHMNQKQEEGSRNPHRPVVGRSNKSTGLRATPMPSRDFFIYRIHKDDGVKELTEFLSKNNVMMSELVVKSHSESKYDSFKLSVSTEDAAKVNDPLFWPAGIYIYADGEKGVKGAHPRIKG